MTENEAKAKLERTSILWESATNTEIVEAVKIAIRALEDVQQYRAIGTVEECRGAVERMKPRKVKRFTKCNEIFYQCGACDRDVFIHEKNCAICGQALDWNKEK